MQLKLDFSTPPRTPKKKSQNASRGEEKENQIPRMKAKRCLFGKSDPVKVRELLQNEIDSILKVSFPASVDQSESRIITASDWSEILNSDWGE